MYIADRLTLQLLRVISNVRAEFVRLRALEARPGRTYTASEIAARKEFLHRQLVWIGRRDEAERRGEAFDEQKPGQ